MGNKSQACPQAAHSLGGNNGDLKNRNKEQIWSISISPVVLMTVTNYMLQTYLHKIDKQQGITV